MIKKLRYLILTMSTVLCSLCLVAFGFIGLGNGAFAEEADANSWTVEPNAVRWVSGNFDADVNIFIAEPKTLNDDERVHFSVLDAQEQPITMYPTGSSGITKAVSLSDIAVQYMVGTDGNYYRVCDNMTGSSVNIYKDEYVAAFNMLEAGAYKLKAEVNKGTDLALSFVTDLYVLDSNSWVKMPTIISWTYGNFNSDLNVLYAQAAALPELDGADVQQPEGGATDVKQHDRVHFSILDTAGDEISVTFRRDGEEEDTFLTLTDIDVQLGSDNADSEYYKVLGDYVVGINSLPVGQYILRAWVNEVGNEYGVLTGEVTFGVIQAQNGWLETPNIIRWTYGDYDRDVNLITAKPLHYLSVNDIIFSVTDVDGIAVAGLEEFTLADTGLVKVQTAEKLAELHAGTYCLTATVNGSDNFAGIVKQTIVFNVLQSSNDWLEYPSIETWKDGEFNSEVNIPTAQAKFGTAVIVITDVDTGEEVYYDSVNGINRLAEMRPDSYKFTVTVAGNSDYKSLEKTLIFRVFEADDIVIGGGGLPWWAVLLIVIGALAVVAVVFIVLHVKGVLQMFTSKMLASFRAKADIDATIAAVRVGRITAYAQHTMMQLEASDREQQALADAENEKNLALAAAQAKEEKKAARRAAALAEKARSPEEKAAALEQKAVAMKERAAALKARAQATEEKAAAVEEKAASLKNASQANQNGDGGNSSKDMAKAEALEQKAKETEARAEELKARAEIVRDIAASRSEKKGKASNDKSAKAKADEKPTDGE